MTKGPKVAFSMMGSSNGGSNGDEPRSRKKNPTPATVRVTTGLGHKVVKPEREMQPEDLSQPAIATVEAIDWKQQPAIPANKIDWQGQGEPLMVRPTFGTLMAIVTAAVSVVGAGAFFYWGVRTHVSDQRIHLKPNGTLPELLSERYETRTEAKAARAKLAAQVGGKVEKVGTRVDKLDNRLKKMQQTQDRDMRRVLRAIKGAPAYKP